MKNVYIIPNNMVIPKEIKNEFNITKDLCKVYSTKSNKINNLNMYIMTDVEDEDILRFIHRAEEDDIIAVVSHSDYNDSKIIHLWKMK